MDNSRKPFIPNAITLATILLSSMVILMGAAAVAPALRGIGGHFGQTESMTALVIGLPALSVAVFGFAVGYLADRFGKVKVLFACLAVFTVMGTLPYFLNDYTAILAAASCSGSGSPGSRRPAPR